MPELAPPQPLLKPIPPDVLGRFASILDLHPDMLARMAFPDVLKRIETCLNVLMENRLLADELGCPHAALEYWTRCRDACQLFVWHGFEPEDSRKFMRD